MSEIDSLEDMLAALETPSNQGRQTGGGRGGGGRPQSSAPSRVSTQVADDDIDAFLNEIDQESKRPAPAAQNRGGNQTANRAPAQSNAGNAGNRGPAQSNAGNRAPAQSSARPPQNNARPQSMAVGDGQSELTGQGYEIHNNKGKWYSPPKTNKASDFRINGTTSTRVGFVHAITLRSLDDYGNPAKIDSPKDFIGITMTHQESGANVQTWIRDNGDCTYNCAFFADKSGTVRMEIKLCGNPMFDINVQIEDIGESLWTAKPNLPAMPKQLFVINIVTVDGSRPEGVAPFEVQTMGDAEQLRLVNNGDGTYKFQCVPQSNGHLTVQISLHGQPIRDSPVTVKVGDGKNQLKVKQESGPVEVVSDTRTRNQSVVTPSNNNNNVYEADQYGDDYQDPPPMDDDYNDNNNMGGNTYGGNTYGNNNMGSTFDTVGGDEVSNDDLAALLDELGG